MEKKIIISGVAGTFPDSEDIYKFRDNLFSKVDLVSEDYRRWKPNHPEVPQRTGKIFDIESFDLGFFGVASLQSDYMDPMTRIILEKSFEAIMDAGYHPLDLIETNTAVIVGMCTSETEKQVFYSNHRRRVDPIMGSQRSMIAKRISYNLRLKSIAFTVDTACSSSLSAVEHAYTSIKDGRCDRALVCCVHLCLAPAISLQFSRLGVLSCDGCCKSFDDAQDGYARSEGIVAVLLEKAQDAKRIYAEIVHAQTNCDGYKERGINFPSSRSQKMLLKNFYENCKVDPMSLTFLEAHATGTKVGDPQEIKTLDEIFCKARTSPLYIGSVKSNIGHNESSSGLCSVIKLVIAMETGYIPPNINYNKPLESVEGLKKGRMIVVDKKLPLPDDRGLFAVNNFGFGGANAHVLLHWNPKTKTNDRQSKGDLPRLVCVSGRTYEGVNTILDNLQGCRCDLEYAYLIHQVFRKTIENHLYRAYGIYSKEGELTRSVSKVEMKKPKLCLVFQKSNRDWLRVGPQLITFPNFAATIRNIHDILLEVGQVNFLETFNNSDNLSLVNQILLTVAFQISLANVLKEINVIPHRILGVGSGELAAAYMANSLTLKQAILRLFHFVSNTNKDDKKDWMTSHGVMVTRNCYEKCFPMEERSTKYFARHIATNDVQNLFARDAIVLVIGASTDKMLSRSVSLVQTNSKDIVYDFLNNLGRLYGVGLDMELTKLYPGVPIPVSRGTPMLSPVIKWNHTRDCKVHFYDSEMKRKDKHRVIHILPKTQEWNFIFGHLIDGRNLFPATGYLYLVWESFSLVLNKSISEMKVVFEDVRYIRAVNVSIEDALEFVVAIQTGTNKFEITEGGTVVVTGKVYEKTHEQIPSNVEILLLTEEDMCLSEDDVYKELTLRGYHYNGIFKGIWKSNADASNVLIKWNENWIAFLDCLLQTLIFGEDTRMLSIPTSIHQLIIDAPKHISIAIERRNMIQVQVDKNLDIIRAGGTELKSLGMSVIPRKKDKNPHLEVYKFIPNENECNVADSIRTLIQIVWENSNTTKFKVLEYYPEEIGEDQLLCPMIQKTLDDIPLAQSDLLVLSKKSMPSSKITVQNKPLSNELNCLVLIVHDVLESIEIATVSSVIKNAKGFVISRENLNTDLAKFKKTSLKVICSSRTDKEILVLLQPNDRFTKKYHIIDVTDASENFEWLPKLQDQFTKEGKVVIYAQGNKINGILGLINSLKREYNAGKLCGFYIMDDAPEFDPNLEFYKKQLEKNLFMNIWKNGTWGTYRYLPLPETQLTQNEHCYANITNRGDLSTLSWFEGHLNPDDPCLPEKEMISIYYSALNFRDVMIASGKLSPNVITKNRIEQECVQGIEFSGRDIKGRRVMGLCKSGSLASLIQCDKHFIYTFPNDWTMEQAATVPVAYGTVIQALFMASQPKRGESILIHSGTGGVGQAAINLCLYFGLTIFVTVGTETKRDFIKKHYPEIKEEHIGNSRDISFEIMIEKHTNGRGVDYVLNSLAEEKLLASVRCLARGGKFIEIGKFDMARNSSLALNLLEKETQFVGIALDKFILSGNGSDKQTFNIRLNDLIKCGAVKPLPSIVFAKDEIETAFRYMGQGKHMGKVLIKIRDEPKDKRDIVPRRLFEGIPRFLCKPSCSYIILGGLGGFGLELADFLVMRGAKKIILVSRTSTNNGYQQYRIRIWEKHGVTVSINTCDASTEEGCTLLLNIANDLGPVDGIFNLAASLRDTLFENQTIDDFETSFLPKASSTKHLDSISRKLCPNLRYFVVFSSFVCGRGNEGQTNYGMANSVMERICEKRKREGYPAVAIQWGAIAEVGMVTRMKESARNSLLGAILPQRISNCLEVLDKLLKQDELIVESMVLMNKGDGGVGNDLFNTISNILGVKNLKTISMHSTFPEIGMDSMMAVEIKQKLEREHQIHLTARDIKKMTLTKLRDLTHIQTDNIATVAQSPKEVMLLFDHVRLVESNRLPVIKMKTLVNNIEKAPHIFALPSIGGTSADLESLCKKLKVHVSCLQFLPKNKAETIPQLAESLLPHIQSFAGDLILLAYSFGCVVATELLYLLKAKGKHVKVIFLDGSPDMMKNVAKENFPFNDQSLFQATVLTLLISRYLPYEDIITYQETMLKYKTCEEKVNYLIDELPKMDVSKELITENFVSIYDRLSALFKYKPKVDKLVFSITLFKATQTLITENSFDYNLSHIFKTEAVVHVIKGNHVTILENNDLAEGINRIFGVID